MLLPAVGAAVLVDSVGTVQGRSGSMCSLIIILLALLFGGDLFGFRVTVG